MVVSRLSLLRHPFSSSMAISHLSMRILSLSRMRAGHHLALRSVVALNNVPNHSITPNWYTRIGKWHVVGMSDFLNDYGRAYGLGNLRASVAPFHYDATNREFHKRKRVESEEYHNEFDETGKQPPKRGKWYNEFDKHNDDSVNGSLHLGTAREEGVVKCVIDDFIEKEGKKYLQNLTNTIEREDQSAEELAKTGVVLCEHAEEIRKLGQRLLWTSIARLNKYIKNLDHPTSPDQ